MKSKLLFKKIRHIRKARLNKKLKRINKIAQPHISRIAYKFVEAMDKMCFKMLDTGIFMIENAIL